MSIPSTDRGLRVLSVLAIVFGALTVFSGGQALFGGTQAQAAVGQAVGFVLWFNFLAGFGYVATGLALWRGWRWGALGAVLLAVSTAVIAAAFAWHVGQGGAFEPRTMGALGLRLGFWLLVAWWAKRR
jgi:hypothetical protein